MQIDLDRIRNREELDSDDTEYDGVAKIVESKKRDATKDNLKEETLAQSLAICDGDLSLYDRAMRISKRDARRVVAEKQGENPNFSVLDDVMADLTDDEEINEEIKSIALGRLKLS